MPLQDLTPELRTRLNRVEKAVGWFVMLATLLLLTGFGFYIYATAKTRGWFVTKLNYATGLNDAAGFKPGNPVKLMGFDVGEVTRVEPNPPEQRRGVTIYFNIREPYWTYIWYDSHVRVVSDFLGNRYLEVEKGRWHPDGSRFGQPTAFTNESHTLMVLNRTLAWQQYNVLMAELPTNSLDSALVDVTNRLMKLLQTETNTYYTNALEAGYERAPDPSLPTNRPNYCYIPAIDTPALGDRLNTVANSVEAALPNILKLTNQLAGILSNANNAVAHLDTAIAHVDPIITNLAVVTGNLRDPNGSLGNWIIPTNLSAQLHDTLHSADVTLVSAHAMLDHTDTNVTMLAIDLDHTLQHLSDITSNLNAEVETNTNLITDIDRTIAHTDDLIQGLKRHWLLRSAFKKKPVKDHKEDNKSEVSPAFSPKVKP